ncbi:YqaA family protein [Palleronia caenipelagi]|uniref:DedA family protein n=1 Tax=Palleronia caenipelagi TaxID=2489174 RepID=A0A547PQI9_9RHOB|nr:YqaA family protein [Palleronia caenipelagi]TRD16413.1 DedA family protein [Palleronia caenipelagi]
MLRRLYDWTISLAASPRALWALAFVSFIESSVFPIPPDVLIIPMVIAAPKRAWIIALVATLSSVAGALLGYFIGWGFWEQIGRPVLEFYGKTDSFDHFRESYADWGAWAVLVAGVTPLPFKVITILSGATGLSLGVFVIASIIARGLRFFVIAALLYFGGPPIRIFIEERLGLVFTLFCVMLIGGFLMVGLL